MEIRRRNRRNRRRGGEKKHSRKMTRGRRKSWGRGRGKGESVRVRRDGKEKGKEWRRGREGKGSGMARKILSLTCTVEFRKQLFSPAGFSRPLLVRDMLTVSCRLTALGRYNAANLAGTGNAMIMSCCIFFAIKELKENGKHNWNWSSNLKYYMNNQWITSL